jgi:type I restriction enzyme M protein
MESLDHWFRITASESESNNLNIIKCILPHANQEVIRLSLKRMYEDFIKETGLIVSENLKPQFKDIRNFLAGRVTGATRDETLIKELIKIIFCKIKDEHNYLKNKRLSFFAKNSESDIDVYQRIKNIFSDIKITYPELFDASDEINLDPASIRYIVEKLEKYSFTLSKRDPVGDAFEVFIGNNLRGAEGQFFTPRNVINMIVEMIDPEPGQLIIDPACGTGGFLSVCLHYLKLKNGFDKLDEFSSLVERSIFGIDKDQYLAELAMRHVAIMGNCHPQIICTNSLEKHDSFIFNHSMILRNEYFDIIMTNPPFGSNIDVGPESLLKHYDLAYKWECKKGKWEKTKELDLKVPPQILFVERCLKLLKDGGKLGIVLPESIFSSKGYQYVVNYITSNSRILGIISMPEELFKTSGKSGTHTKTCVVILEKGTSKMTPEDNVFMAEALWCGHDSRGLTIPHDDLPEIIKRFKSRKYIKEYNHLGFNKKYSDISDLIFIPKYYDPEIEQTFDRLKNSHELVSIHDLIKRKIISISTGDEIGKLSYGTGDIPFVRSSDISNWEIKVDPKHCVSEEIYLKYKKKQDIELNDILLVKDGTYLIGTTAIITEYDTKMIFQSHIYKIRVLKSELLSPFLLLAILSSEIVQRQINSKKFSQDIIDSLGRRLYEIIIPIPKNPDLKEKIARDVKDLIESRIKSRELIKTIRSEVVAAAA